MSADRIVWPPSGGTIHRIHVDDGGSNDQGARTRLLHLLRLQESSTLYDHAPDVSRPTAGPSQVQAFSEGTLLIEIAVGDEIVWSGWATEVAKKPQKLADKGSSEDPQSISSGSVGSRGCG